MIDGVYCMVTGITVSNIFTEIIAHNPDDTHDYYWGDYPLSITIYGSAQEGTDFLEFIPFEAQPSYSEVDDYFNNSSDCTAYISFEYNGETKTEALVTYMDDGIMSENNTWWRKPASVGGK